MTDRLSPERETEIQAWRKRVADLLWWSVPSSDNAEATDITNDLLDNLVAAVRAETAAELAAVRAERDEALSAVRYFDEQSKRRKAALRDATEQIAERGETPSPAHWEQWHQYLDIDPDLAGRDYSTGGAS